MDKVVMTSEQQLAFDGFIDVMVQIYKMTADKIDYPKHRSIHSSLLG